MKSSKERRIQKEEIHDKMFSIPKRPAKNAVKFFRRPPYYSTTLGVSDTKGKGG